MIRLTPEIGQSARVSASMTLLCSYANNLVGEFQRACMKQFGCRRAGRQKGPKYNTRVNLSLYQRQKSVSSATRCVRVECFNSFSPILAVAARVDDQVARVPPKGLFRKQSHCRSQGNRVLDG